MNDWNKWEFQNDIGQKASDKERQRKEEHRPEDPSRKGATAFQLTQAWPDSENAEDFDQLRAELLERHAPESAL